MGKERHKGYILYVSISSVKVKSVKTNLPTMAEVRTVVTSEGEGID